VRGVSSLCCCILTFLQIISVHLVQINSTQTSSFDTSNANKINNYIPRFQKSACATLALAATMPIPERTPPQPSYNFEHMCTCKGRQKRHVTELRPSYTAIVPQSGGASLSPIGMFSASITCSSCGITCEQALNRINQRKLQENSPEIRRSGGRRIARTAGAAAAAAKMTTKVGKRRAFSWSSEALGLG
jgi:hypothetical protein